MATTAKPAAKASASNSKRNALLLGLAAVIMIFAAYRLFFATSGPDISTDESTVAGEAPIPADPNTPSPFKDNPQRNPAESGLPTAREGPGAATPGN